MRWLVALCLFSALPALSAPPGGLTYVESSSRFLFIPEAVPDAEVPRWQAALAGHVNGLSRLPKIVPPAVVPGSGGRLLRLDPADYGWPASLWGRLGKAHKAPAVWFGADRVSAYPADWFVRHSLTQTDRGPGYYDFLGTETGADFAALTGFRPGREKGVILARVKDSGAAPRPRLIVASLGLNGPVWEAFVSDDPREERDPLTTSPPALKFGITEKAGGLPGGFMAWWAATRKGSRLNSVPSFAGRDHTARGKSDTVRVGISCLRCHGQRAGLHVLHPGGIALAERSAAAARIAAGREAYSRAVAKATGRLTVAQWAQAVTEIWEHGSR